MGTAFKVLSGFLAACYHGYNTLTAQPLCRAETMKFVVFTDQISLALGPLRPCVALCFWDAEGAPWLEVPESARACPSPFSIIRA